jgi:hydroxymethylglutaryl-CoA lyase
MSEHEDVRTALWPERVTIMDVGPRDGLQNEPYILPTEQKIRLIGGLVDAGVKWIQATSFVHPKAVPQMADAAEVVAGLPPHSDVRYVALIPNEKGYERALAAGLKHVGLVLSATETMNQKNLNMSVAQSMAIAGRLLQRAKSDGLTVRVDVSVAFVCAYEGAVDPQRVVTQTEALFKFGADQVCLCDTTGRADPRQVAYLFDQVRRRHGIERLAGHFHNTYGMAIANTLAAMQQGIAFFDASIAGLGGCPYSPGATGNTPTEDVVYLCRQMGVETGIDLEKLCDVSDLVRTFSGRLPPSAYYRATRLKQTDDLPTSASF